MEEEEEEEDGRRMVEGRGPKRRGEEMLPKIFSGFSEGGCWLIIGRFEFRLEGSYSMFK